jgi:group I intron endonuclease
MSGIYKMTNIINNKCYIGSAIDIKNRFKQHKSLLKNNKHFNNHLQSSYNKYGKDNFLFEIIENTTNDLLIIREQYWINFLDSNNNEKGYNKRLIPTSNLGIKATKETKEKLRISHLGIKRSEETQKKISQSQYKKICQFTKEGKYLNTFDSFKDAVKSLGKTYTTSLSMCIKGKIPSAFGYMWCYEKDKNNFKPNVPKKKGQQRKKKIEIMSLSTNKKFYFNSLTEASEKLKISISTLSSKNKTKEYIWKKNVSF